MLWRIEELRIVSGEDYIFYNVDADIKLDWDDIAVDSLTFYDEAGNKVNATQHMIDMADAIIDRDAAIIRRYIETDWNEKYMESVYDLS